MEVHEAGGGIDFTVERTKADSEDELLGLFISLTKPKIILHLNT